MSEDYIASDLNGITRRSVETGNLKSYYYFFLRIIRKDVYVKRGAEYGANHRLLVSIKYSRNSLN